MRLKVFLSFFLDLLFLVSGCGHKSFGELVMPHYVRAPAVSHSTDPVHTTVNVVPETSKSPILVVHGMNVVTGNFPNSCQAQDNGELPDPICTPGSVRDDVDPNHPELTVCKPGWSESVLPPRNDFAYAKTRLMKIYDVPASKRSITELDHKVPRSLGGSNDVTNLWPEVSDRPNKGFANNKDRVEIHVHAAFCNDELKKNGHSLLDAQVAMARNWMTAEQMLGLPVSWR